MLRSQKLTAFFNFYLDNVVNFVVLEKRIISQAGSCYGMSPQSHRSSRSWLSLIVSNDTVFSTFSRLCSIQTMLKNFTDKLYRFFSLKKVWCVGNVSLRCKSVITSTPTAWTRRYWLTPFVIYKIYFLLHIWITLKLCNIIP